MVNQIFGCNSKERPLLDSPSNCPSLPKQLNKNEEQNSYSSRSLHLWVYLSPSFFSLSFSTLYIYEYLNFFFFATGPSLSMSITVFSQQFFSFFFRFKTISVLALFIFLCTASIMAWATNTAVKPLVCKAFCSFSLTLSKIWLPTSSSSFRLSSFSLRMLSLNNYKEFLK